MQQWEYDVIVFMTYTKLKRALLRKTTMTDQISIAEYQDRIASLAPALRERTGEAEKQRRLSQQNRIMRKIKSYSCEKHCSDFK